MRGQGAAGHGLARYVPAVGWLGGYQRGWLRGGPDRRPHHRAGFKAGTGLLIAAGQLGKILGVPQKTATSSSSSARALAHLGDVNWPTFALALASIALLLGLRRWSAPSRPACPSSPPRPHDRRADHAGGGLSQTAVNRESGARSQVAGITTALVVLLTLAFLTPCSRTCPRRPWARS